MLLLTLVNPLLLTVAGTVGTVSTVPDSSDQDVFFSEVVKMIKLVIVIPATKAVSKRSFSTMSRLDTYLRTNMGSSRLNNAIVLHILKDRLDKLSMVDVANDFVFESDHRKRPCLEDSMMLI